MRGHELRRGWKPIAAAALAGLALATPASAAPARCIVVDVPAPVVLPDGVERPAGALRICATRELSPVTAIHRLSIDGMPVAYAFSRMGWSEVDAPSEPFVLFHRTPQGALRVVGYAWPEGEAARTYLLANAAPSWAAASRMRGRGVLSPRVPEIVLAAVRGAR